VGYPYFSEAFVGDAVVENGLENFFDFVHEAIFAWIARNPVSTADFSEIFYA